MQIGQVFKANGKKFGYIATTRNKCVQAYDLEEKKVVQFNKAASENHIIPMLTTQYNFDYELSQATINAAKEMQDAEHKRQSLMYSLRMGDKFIGQDDKVYEFVKVKLTRFECLRDGISYTAQAGFIKEKL